MSGIPLCQACMLSLEEQLAIDPDCAELPDVAPASMTLVVAEQRLGLCENHYRAALRIRTRLGARPILEVN